MFPYIFRLAATSLSGLKLTWHPTMQNENKNLADTLKHSDASWDEKLATVLAKLDGYQDAKDNPGRVSVDTSLDEL